MLIWLGGAPRASSLRAASTMVCSTSSGVGGLAVGDDDDVELLGHGRARVGGGSHIFSWLAGSRARDALGIDAADGVRCVALRG